MEKVSFFRYFYFLNIIMGTVQVLDSISDEYKNLKKIAQGGFSVIYKGKHKKSKREYIII